VLKGTGSSTWAAAFSANGRQIAWGHTSKYSDHADRGPLEMALRLPGVGETLGEPATVASQEGWVRARTRFAGWSLQHRSGGAYGYDAILDILQDGKVQASVERDASDGLGHWAYGFTPDGETVVSGGSGRLMAYHHDGTKIGDFVGHEAVVWAVAVSPDGKYLVSGAADQTVRLWNLQTQELLVTLFYGTDGEWVMWTPEGFFTGSPEGRKRVGWQVNQGVDKEARYVSAAQLREVLFRPDLVVEKILGDPGGKVRSEADTISEIIRTSFAPEVTIISPAEGARADEISVTVTARVADKGGGIGRIEWRINGQLIGTSYGAAMLNAKGEISRSFDLALPENAIEVVALNNKNLVESLPARVSVKVDAKALKGVPDLYILAAGVNDYNDVKRNLHFAVSDAKDLSETIADAGSTFYRHKPQIVLLRDGEVTAERLAAAFKELGAKIKANDVFLFFIAGHGKTIGGNYYFVPGGVASLTDEAVQRQGFGPQQLRDWFAAIQAQKSIWIFDTCESGAAENIFLQQQIAARGEAEDDAAWQRLKDATGRAIFLAASGQQMALEGFPPTGSRRHGVLTYTILEGLARAGDGKKDKIDILDLKSYVEEKVPQYSRELNVCRLEKGQETCQRQKPKVPFISDNYPLVPRYEKILAKLNADGPVISTKPTHVVMATTELLDQAARGSPVTGQLEIGTLVTVFEPIEGGWAHVAQEGKPIGYVREERLVKMKQ
jgi:WD40 repeat protein